MHLVAVSAMSRREGALRDFKIYGRAPLRCVRGRLLG